MYTWLLDLRKAWAANIAIEWLLRKNFKQHYINTESENKKIWPDHYWLKAGDVGYCGLDFAISMVII